MSSSFVIIGLRFRCFEVGERVSVGSNHDCREREHAQDKPDTHSQQPTSLATEHLKQSKDRQSPLVGLTWPCVALTPGVSDVLKVSDLRSSNDL